LVNFPNQVSGGERAQSIKYSEQPSVELAIDEKEAVRLVFLSVMEVTCNWKEDMIDLLLTTILLAFQCFPVDVSVVQMA